MRFYQFAEARRNPEQNPRERGHSAAVKYLEQFDDLSHIGVRMTSIPKLGLNPTSRYDTPFGICFYPADYYLQVKKGGAKLPFAETAQYIQIFKWGSNRVLTISDLDQQEYKEILDKLASMGDASQIDQLIKQAEIGARRKSLGGLIWYVLMRLSDVDNQVSGRKWASMLRKLGYDVVIDLGEGIIHPSEPTQSIVLNPRIVTHMNQIQSHYQSRTGRGHTSVEDKVNQALEYGDPIPPNMISAIAKDPKLAFIYATKIRAGKPFPQGEAAIASNLKYAKSYAQFVLKDPEPDTWGQRYLAGQTS